MNRYRFISLGTVAFLGAYALVQYVNSQAHGEGAFGPTHGTLTSRSAEWIEASRGERTAGHDASVAPDTPATQVDAIALTASERKVSELFLGLAKGSGWHRMDLTDWRSVDQLARSFEHSLPALVKLGRSDARALLGALESAKSLKTRQTLLIALGAVRGGAADEFEPYLLDPATQTAAAYALGRCGSPLAVALLQERLASMGRFSRELTGIDLGLAARGAEAFDDLLQLSRQRLIVDWTGGAVTPLELLRDPEARSSLKDLASSQQPEPLRLRALRAYANTFTALDGNREENESLWILECIESQSLSIEGQAEAMSILAHTDPGLALEGLADWVDLGQPFEHIEQSFESIKQLDERLTEEEIGLLLGFLDHADERVRSLSLGLVASATHPLAQRALAQRCGSLDSTGFGRILEGTRLLAITDRKLEPELVASIEEQLRVRTLTEDQRIAGLHVLISERGLEPFADEIDALVDAWPVGDPESAGKLMRLAVGLGAPGSQLLMDAYGSSEEFITRLDFVAVLEESFQDQAEVHRFMRERVIPDLRQSLVAQVEAPLAFFKRGEEEGRSLSSTLVNLFANYGSMDDMALLRSLPDALAQSAQRWPEALRGHLQASFSECALRTEDLLALGDA